MLAFRRNKRNYSFI